MNSFILFVKVILWMPILVITYTLHLVVLLTEVFIFRYINMGINFLMESYIEDIKKSCENTPFEKLINDFLNNKEK